MSNRKSIRNKQASKIEERGPNGYRVGYTENGDKVEWVPDQEESGEEIPIILRRNDNDINAAYDEFWDKVWWSRNVSRIRTMASKLEGLSEAELVEQIPGKQALDRIEKKYGQNNLGWTEFELGMLNGRLSAMAWVSGNEWDESLDT